VEKTQATFHQKTTAQIAQWVVKQICIQEVTGSNPGGEQIVFSKFIFDSTVICHSKHALKRDLSEIKHMSSGNSNMLMANKYLLLFVLYSTLKALM